MEAKCAEDCVCSTPRHELIDGLANNDSFSGKYVEMTVGEGVVIGDVCYLKSDGKMWKADADAEATANGLIMMALETIAQDATGKFLLEGFIRHDDWDWTVGAKLYISTTPGDPTETAPAGAGDIVRLVAYATHADRLYFNPSSTYEEIAA